MATDARPGGSMTETVEGFRLSPQQHRVWTLQEAGGGRSFRVRSTFRVTASLDGTRVARALDAVAGRHEILRTTFRRLPGMVEPLQVVHDRSMVIFEDTTAPGYLERAHDAAWDLSEGPVSRVVLRREGSEASTLDFDFSALAADPATLERLAVEVAREYGPAPRDGAVDSEPPLQYADVAEWWNELAEKSESRPGLEYWRRVDLADAGRLELPFEMPAGVAAFDPARVRVELTPAAADRLDRLDRLDGPDGIAELGAGPEDVLLCSWIVLLRRSSDGRNPIVGYADPGRRLPELQTAMGPLERLLPVSVSLDDQPSFRDAVLRVAGRVREQGSWSDLFAWRSRTGSDGPGASDAFFAFAFEYRPGLSGRIGSSELHLVETGGGAEPFKVRLSCVRVNSRVEVHLDYDASRIRREEASALAARFGRLLDGALSDPERSVDELEILPESERQRILIDWNETACDFPSSLPVHERFERIAVRTPESVAVVCGDRRLTYADLNARANAIAHRLRASGVGPDVRVGLHVERSVEMIVGLLAIWKAGGAYVPLDPSLPPERLAFLLEDTGAKALLTKEGLEARVPFDANRTVVLDAAAGDASNPDPSARPEHLAYILFTSGSTGRPKGVAVEHRQVSNYVDAILERLEPAPGSSFATVTTLAADLGNTSIFPALSTGGRLHVISEQRSSDPEGLAEDFSREPVDYLKIVPSHLGALLSSSRPHLILPRRALILGGEPSSWELVEKIRRLAPECRILNHYGPTEATIGVTTYEVGPDSTEARKGPVPVGRPLRNCRVYILDGAGRVVPIGVAGELHVAGAGLARGYLNRPELTAERFIEREIGGRRERLYRSGDLARYRTDGAIELLGRTDDQVKIHGFRIEPGEIESALRENPSVREAVVLPREFSEGKRLVAYVVARPGEDVSPADLRRSLAEKLPEFMVPWAFVGLPRLPLTPNGKIDRNSLPMPDLSRSADRREIVAPRSAAEETLARVWKDVLGTARLSIHDNFFELGGDSILAIQIIARAARAGLRLTPRQLFEHQTIAELASVAEQSTAVKTEQGAVSGPIPLTPIQRWFFAQRLVDPGHFNQSVVLESREPLDRRALEIAVAVLLRHHDALRLRFRRGDSGFEQSNAESESGPVFGVAPVEGLEGERRTEAIQRLAGEAQSSLDLSRGPLVRVVLFPSGGAHPDTLLFTVHHLAVDGVSWRILLEDFERAYFQSRAGETPSLAPKTSSFREWALGLEAMARSASVDREASFWTSRVTPETAALPRDRAGENTVATARSEVRELSEEETRELLLVVPAAYRSQINDALVAALAQALAAWTGRKALSIELEGHGREDVLPGIDLSRTVGWFTARFPVLLELPDADDASLVLSAVKEQLRAVPDRGIGYGLLRYMRPGSSEGWEGLPEPEVSFNYLGQLDRMMSEESSLRVAPTLGPMRSPRNARSHVLSVEAKVRSGRLQVAWIYSQEIHDRQTIERLADGFETALRALIAGARAGSAAAYTPSDFPKAKLNQKDLDRLFAGMKAGGTRG